MGMSGRLLRPRATGFHPEAADWRSRVVANGGTVSTATVQAVDRFCRSIDANGLRSLMWRVNIMAGDNLSAVLVPLFRSNVSLGVQGNATDENDNFVSGDYTATSGLLANGSNKRLKTGLALNFTSQRHMACFVHTANTAAFRCYVGARGGNNAGEGVTGLHNTSPADVIQWRNWTDAGSNSNVASTVADGEFIFGTHGDGASTSVLYKNGVSVGTPATGSNAGSVTQPISVFAFNAAGSFSEHSNGRLGGYSLGGNMTASQALRYYNIWDTLLLALGRK